MTIKVSKLFSPPIHHCKEAKVMISGTSQNSFNSSVSFKVGEERMKRYILNIGVDDNKVNRFLARYSLRATNQPNNSAPNETYMCQKKHIFWGKWPFLGPNILIICEGAKVLVHTYQKTTEAPRSHCFLGQAWHQMDHIG